MANTTWRAETNEVLKLMGLGTIDTDAKFNDDTLLEKPERQTKYILRLAQDHLSPRLVTQFATRRIPLSVFDGTGVYNIDAGIFPGAIKVRSFFNVTSGGTNNRELLNWDEDEFKRAWPVVADIPEGPPARWILLTPDRTQESPLYQVRIFPTPDQSYSLEFKANLMPYSLTQASSVLLWPPEYMYVLREWTWSMVERGLGEGKEGLIMQLAQQAFKDVQLTAGYPEDVRHAVRTMGRSVLRSMKNVYGGLGRYIYYTSSQ